MKNSPHISVVVTCSLNPLEDRFPREKILLKFPDNATPSLVKITENKTKHNRNIKNNVPLTIGENENIKPSLPKVGENISNVVESGANNTPCGFVGKYS